MDELELAGQGQVDAQLSSTIKVLGLWLRRMLATSGIIVFNNYIQVARNNADSDHNMSRLPKDDVQAYMWFAIVGASCQIYSDRGRRFG